MLNPHKFLNALIMALTLSAVLTQAHAQENKPFLEKDQFSIGVGLSYNETSSPNQDDVGFQFIGAYSLDQINLMDGVDSSVEFGFMDFGFDQDDTGIWASYVVDGAISGQLGWLAQAGFDFGDDNGFLLGAGLKYMLDTKSDLRFEYVMRDEVDSFLINFLYHL